MEKKNNDIINSYNLGITVWGDRVSPVFDCTKECAVFKIDNIKISNIGNIRLSNIENCLKINKLVDAKIKVLLCGAISGKIQLKLREKGIEVYSFITGEINEVLQAWVENGEFTRELIMPGFRASNRGKCKRNRFQKRGMSKGSYKNNF